MSRSRREPLRRSSSMATADGTPPEFHPYWGLDIFLTQLYSSFYATVATQVTLEVGLQARGLLAQKLQDWLTR